ncbi:MAG: endonuclease III [Clostridia bacterium]|nr:endonuclease III [Clostridia bacterium]
MTENTKAIIGLLEEEFPNPRSELRFDSVYQLLVAVILSAQCTDKRVNLVTEKLFQVAPTPQKMLLLSPEELEELIHSCGFFKMKAKHILEASAQIMALGGVPSTQEELAKLSGVGRKTANVVYAVGFGGAAIAVDTHVFRVSRRLGLAAANTPEGVELQLQKAIDKDLWNVCHHYLLLHGRYVCRSQSPDCKACKLTKYCAYYAETSEKGV